MTGKMAAARVIGSAGWELWQADFLLDFHLPVMGRTGAAPQAVWRCLLSRMASESPGFGWITQTDGGSYSRARLVALTSTSLPHFLN